MKKLTLLISIALLFTAAGLTSCAGGGGGSILTGYNDISWTRDLAPPDAAKGYTVNLPIDGTCSAGTCLAVAYTTDDLSSTSSESSTEFTAVAIANSDRTERLIIIFKGLLLTQGTDITGQIIDEDDITAKYVDATDPSNRTFSTDVTGPTNIDVNFTPIAVTQADATDKYHYLAEFVFNTGFTAGGVSISGGQTITAMMYPLTDNITEPGTDDTGEPDLTE